MKYVKATISCKDIVAISKKGILVLFHGHLHADIPPWSFAFSIDTTKMAANKTRDFLSDSQNLVSVTTCGSVFQLQVRHTQAVVDLPDANFFNHADARVILQPLDDIPHSIWVRRVFVAHE